MKKGLFQILSANLILLVLNIANSFLLPKFLSIDSYAVLKTYTLYIGYVGFLSLGYADGIYLDYGGKRISDFSLNDVGADLKSYFALEGILSAVVLVVSLIVHNVILAAFAIGSLLINIIGYYKNLYQAVGDYKLYGWTLNAQTILMVIFNLILIFAAKVDNPHFYIGSQLFSAAIIAFYLTFTFVKRTEILNQGKVALTRINQNVSSGFVLMLGNFSSSIFTSIDRWFVKALMTNIAFAQYSFAVSLENLINVFVTPVTVSLYNVFCTKRDTEYVLKVKRMALLWGFLLITAAFPVKLILKFYLTKYIDSSSIIFTLFAAQAFYTVIKGIHINLYKVERKQNRYFVVMAVMIALAILLNVVFYLIEKSARSFAFATLLTAILWFVYCEIERRDLHYSVKEYLFIILLLLVYSFAGGLNSVDLGLIIYCVTYVVLALLLMRDSIKQLLDLLRTTISGHTEKEDK